MSDDFFELTITGETNVISGDISSPMIEIAMVGTGYNQAGPGVYAYDGSNWFPLTSRFFIQKTGDPSPPGLTANDIVLKQN